MLFAYYRDKRTKELFDSFEEMSKIIPLRYELTLFEEVNMTLFEAKGHWRLNKVYDAYHAVFMLPNVIFLPGANNGYMPGLHIDLITIDHVKFCSEFVKRGHCYISEIIVSEKNRIISGKYNYYSPDNEQDSYRHLWGVAMRIAMIDDMLNDLP